MLAPRFGIWGVSLIVAATADSRIRETPSSRLDTSSGLPRVDAPQAHYLRCLVATNAPGELLLGRDTERQALERLLAAVRGGQSGVLVVRGEPGVGKTALLRYAIEAASGFRVLRALGIESEMELPFAAIQQ